jgi:hypothetical protein
MVFTRAIEVMCCLQVAAWAQRIVAYNQDEKGSYHELMTCVARLTSSGNGVVAIHVG